MSAIKGYKVFRSDWTCREKQYTCPGEFEEDVKLSVCNKGMHFCKKAVDCFNYYDFNPDYKVAEVIAYGEVAEEGDKCCTDKLKIIREIPWSELLEIVNTGKGCTGKGNSGDRNSGDRNSGGWNSGYSNSGYSNSGDRNSGDWNSGSWNSGNCNSGDCNSGNYNSGNYNSGNCNSGDFNSGGHNSGGHNSGDCNSGDWNSGDCNSGDWNSGDWNKTSFSNGCFNTVEQKIYLFNKLSEWTYRDWLHSDARALMNQIPGDALKWVQTGDMTDEEKAAHPEHETTGGFLKKMDNSKCAVKWWSGLKKKEKAIIMGIPNFDKAIFKEITGIDIDEEQGRNSNA